MQCKDPRLGLTNLNGKLDHFAMLQKDLVLSKVKLCLLMLGKNVVISARLLSHHATAMLSLNE